MSCFVNLLPMKVRRRQLLMQRLRQWLLLSLFVLLAGGGFFVYEFQSVTRTEHQLHARRVEVLPLEKLEQEASRLRKQLSEMEQRESLSLELLRRPPVLLTLAAVSRAASSSEGRVCVQRMTFTQDAAGAAAAESSPAAASPKQQHFPARRILLLLEGLGVDHPAVAQFVAELRQADGLKQVELKSAGPATGSFAGTRIYRVECLVQ